MTAVRQEQALPRIADSTAATVVVGPGLAMVTADVLAVFEPLNARLAGAIWSALGESNDVDVILELLMAEGLKNLGGFAIVLTEADGVRSIVRGSARAEVDGIVVSGATTRSWDDKHWPVGKSLLVALGAQSRESPFVVSSGLLPGVCASRGFSVDELTSSCVDRVADFDPNDVVIGWTPQQLLETPPTERASDGIEPWDPPSVRPEAEPEPADAGLTVDVASFDSAQIDDLLGQAEVRQPDAPPETISPTEPPHAERNEYDAMWEMTVDKSVLGAAVPDDLDEGGLISGVPQGSSAPSSGAQFGDHDGHTITAQQLQSARQAAAPMGAPSVQARLCSQGHPNAPVATACRICKSMVIGEPMVIPRPSMGVLRLSTGQSVALDRSVLLGRNPQFSSSAPSELPQIVTLPGLSGVSKTHAIIRVLDWQIVIEDLGSRNGTEVTMPNRPTQRLHPGQPLLLEYGSSVDLGGDVTLTVEAQ